MSTLRTNTLQTLDETVTLDIADIVTGASPLLFRQYASVAALTASGQFGRFDGEQVNLLGYFAGGQGIGGGPLYWDAASTEVADNGTIFQVTGTFTGRWKRKIDSIVYLEWFGILGDGVTTEDAKIRAAIAATPVGGTLFMPNRTMTVLMDIPSGQSSRWQAAANFNKAGMTIVGSHATTFKLKNFTSAYTAYVGVTALGTFRVSASGVKMENLHLDANADNHYEVVGPDKVWEEGPGGRRPPSGIMVTVDDNAANVEDVVVRGCLIERPLQGVYVAGNLSVVGGASLDEPTFFTKTLATNCVVNALVEKNEVTFARGNDYIFITGVRDSSIRDNVSTNSMYHHVRFYAGVESCEMSGNRAYVNYATIAARWNPTDLGYWRTDNPAGVGAASYLIERAGYAIGSTAAQTSANSGNVRRCSMIDNYVWYSSNTETGSIVDTTQATLGSFFAWQVVNGILIANNESHNSPFQVLVAVNSILALNPDAQGVVFSNNRGNNCGKEFIYTLGMGFVFTENTATNCGINVSGFPIVYIQGGSRVYRNTLIWQRSTANTNTIFAFSAYGTPGVAFVSDNVVLGYTGTRMTKLSTDVVHGTDAGGVPLTLLAGWTAGTETALITVNCAGAVTVHGRIASAAGGTDTYASLNGVLVPYRPRANVRYPTWQSATPGVVEGLATAAGSLAATRGALAAGTQFAITASWQSDFRV